MAEVFGHAITDKRSVAKAHWAAKKCPFADKTCTKSSKDNPLGVCSVFYHKKVTPTCPFRFTQGQEMFKDAAAFIFGANDDWGIVPEVKLHGSEEESAGNIDYVLARFDVEGNIVDYGAVEVQAVYISGNVREPFSHFMTDTDSGAEMNWRTHEKYPRPDFLSSSRKRLIPQLVTKGGILNYWKKKLAVVLDKQFYETLPTLPTTDMSEAEVVWLVYEFTPSGEGFTMVKQAEVYTKFEAALDVILKIRPESPSEFEERLQSKLKKIYFPKTKKSKNKTQ